MKLVLFFLFMLPVACSSKSAWPGTGEDPGDHGGHDYDKVTFIGMLEDWRRFTFEIENSRMRSICFY